MKITKYSDSAHGWYRVPMTMVRQAESKGVVFTDYSYRSKSGKYAYLEEDCDASRFFQAMGGRDNFQIEYKYTKGNARSQIRYFPGLKEAA